MATVALLPQTRSQQAKEQRLALMKRRATGLLGFVTLVFVITLFLDADQTWVAYLRATAEASMVGALADWFAVTALFRHPLGIPIPHTAIVPERKDQFGETLGEFVQHSFLTPEIIVERVRSAGVAVRVADWLGDEANAARLARHAADAAVAVADAIRDEDVHRVLEETVRQRIDALPLAPLAGRALRLMTEGNRHHEVLDAVLGGLDRFLDENRASLRSRFEQEAPWWLPGAVEDRIFDRLIDGARRVVADVAADPDHELRHAFDRRVRELAEELVTSPEMLDRGEQLKRDLLTQPELRRWSAQLWTDLKAQLRSQAADPDSELRRRLAAAIGGVGRRLRAEPALHDKAQEAIESGVRYVADHFHDEIAGMVSGTISRWDAREASYRLELLLGPDLQYIRINGTVVGGLAGLVIYSIAQVVG